jgi:hypothetical protein
MSDFGEDWPNGNLSDAYPYADNGFEGVEDHSSEGSSHEEEATISPSTGSAALSAAAALSGRNSTPVYYLRKPDTRHEARFPFVTGSFDEDIVNIAWASCSPQNIVDIFTCKMFGGGKGAQKHMGVWAREFMKFFATLCTDDSTIAGRIDCVLKDKRSALQCDDFEPTLQQILVQAKYLAPARQWLIKHNRTNVLRVVCKTFFPSVTDVQVAQCRSHHSCVCQHTRDQ